jgi:plant 4alpha-monomethylsterol monooxygenase
MGWLDDPRFWALPIGTTLVAMAAFLLFAIPLTLAAARDVPWLRRYRIQTRRPREQRLLIPSLQRWSINNVAMLAASIAAWPLLRSTGIHLGPLPPWYEVVGQVVFFIYLDDVLYWGFHRAMHTRWLFRHVHGVHHRIVTPWAITGNYMHWLEYVGTGFVAMAGPSLLGAHVLTVWIWVAVRQLEAADGHCGYDLPFMPLKWLPLSDGAVHHDFHHAKVHGNYAGFFPWLDRLLGTSAAGYADDRDRRRAL